MKKYKLSFKLTLYGTKTVEAKDWDSANLIAERLEKEITADDMDILDDECECDGLVEVK